MSNVWQVVPTFVVGFTRPRRLRWRKAAGGQQATFTDASRGLVLKVRNREANQAAGGRDCVKTHRSILLKCEGRENEGLP